MVSQSVAYLIDNYMYRQALQLLAQKETVSEEISFLLTLLAERRELKLTLSFDPSWNQYFIEHYAFALHQNDVQEKELLSNYLVELEAKSKTGDIIDFCRAVSPLFFRVLETLVLQKVPQLYSMVKKGKGTSFDKWLIDDLKVSPNPMFQRFYQINKNQPIVNSDSLVDFIEILDYDNQIKSDVKTLRGFEKAIRNPLAHLIKPFDEEILARDTGFSSRHFLDLLVKLLQDIEVNYQRSPFYFDQANLVLIDLLEKYENTKK